MRICLFQGSNNEVIINLLTRSLHCLDLIARKWAKENRGEFNIERWQCKIKHLRQFLRGWAKNVSGIYKREKEKLLNLINELDLKAEASMLDTVESFAKREAKEKLAKLLREEQLKWAFRAKV